MPTRWGWRHSTSGRTLPAPMLLVCAISAAPVTAVGETESSGQTHWPPPVLHFCAAHCTTWYLTSDGQGYTGAPHQSRAEPYGVRIVTFNRDSVVLNRRDAPNQWFPQGLKATITGNVSPTGDSLQDGKIRWTFGQSGIYDMRLTWGRALDSIPGDDNYLPPVVLHFCAAQRTARRGISRWIARVTRVLRRHPRSHPTVTASASCDSHTMRSYSIVTMRRTNGSRRGSKPSSRDRSHPPATGSSTERSTGPSASPANMTCA